MRIVVDVHGGDHGSRLSSKASKAALHKYGSISELHLVGDEGRYERL